MNDANACRRNAIGHCASIGIRTFFVVATLICAGLLTLAPGSAAIAATCSGGTLFEQPLLTNGQPQPDLIVTDGECRVPFGNYYYGNVNIIHNGRLIFEERGKDPTNIVTNFWASSIIVESGGYLYAGAYNYDEPFGTNNGVLTIYLYGKDQSDGKPVENPGQGVPCQSEENNFYAPCGIPKRLWDDNGKTMQGFSNGVNDFFYQYGPLYGDGQCSDKTPWVNGKCGTPAGRAGYFGYKTLAVSYGGGIFLRGFKGAVYDKDPSLLVNRPDLSVEADPLSSGNSWMRLADGKALKTGDASLFLEKDPLTWATNDEIVVTTTDYLPGHSERLKITGTRGEQIDFDAVDSETRKIQWSHNGVRYGGPNDNSGPASNRTQNQWNNRLAKRVKDQLDPNVVSSGAETRAAVALLTRSIRIVSAGDRAGQSFEDASSDPEHCRRTGAKPGYCYSFGATTVIRQGFAFARIQGVEFKQMGQAGRLGHYPVHFHMARQTPPSTYVRDSSVNESMTRWFVIHSTIGVTLARNVGYKSIGHGYYLETGTEADNKFHSNIGIFARAAVANVDLDTKASVPNPQNPRMVPGILADNTDPASIKPPNLPNSSFIYRSDVEYPSVFWITNGWNDFIGNMAAGAGACGAAFWVVPTANSDMVEVATTHEHMKWSGYAGLQKPHEAPNGSLSPGLAGAAPLKSFFKNYATSTMHSFQTTADAPACEGVIAANAQSGVLPVLRAVTSVAPAPARHPVDGHEEADTLNDHYYPHLVGARKPVQCVRTPNGDDCGTVMEVCRHPPQDNCAVTVIDHFTSSFHWSHGNVSAIWLRPQWYLMTNSVLSDVQNGGLTFITGGDYTHSSVIGGYWALAKSSIFIGNTQDNATSVYARNVGPFNGASPLKCDSPKDPVQVPAYCLSANETISMPTTGFFTNQRLANIYDGPSHQDSNVYLDVKTADCPQGDYNGPCIYGTKASYLRLKNEPKNPSSSCYLPNAAIAWKQPNGFFYPPAFHSKNLFFDNVDLRHYVIDPLFKAPDGVPPAKNFGQQGTYLTDGDAVKAQYCIEDARFTDLFNSFTSIDRQTVLNDDDGTLTGLSNTLPEGPLKQTISINEDAFFGAPVETVECGSAKGFNGDAANACKPLAADKPPATARTSPYDYVATVIYHKETPLPQGGNPKDQDVWGTVCSNQTCYGVPLLRQYLTKEEQQHWTDYKCSDQANPPRAPKPECRWPFIRMAGENLSQRETLTINNGIYYVDTTVSRHTQETENYTTVATGEGRSRNVFKSGETYYMFFAYAKTSTIQTYQIYVGNDFNVATGFKPGRMDIDRFEFLDKSSSGTEGWAKAQKSADGVLTIDIDFTGRTVLDPSMDSDLCQPRTFCSLKIDPNVPGKKMCVSALGADDALLKANKNFMTQNDKVCQDWAMKDLDCPAMVKEQNKWTDGGCFAVAFTLPPSFVADDTYHRPEPTTFPNKTDPQKKQGLPDWTTRFTPAVKAPDTCFYPTVPGTDCRVP